MTTDQHAWAKAYTTMKLAEAILKENRYAYREIFEHHQRVLDVARCREARRRRILLKGTC